MARGTSSSEKNFNSVSFLALIIFVLALVVGVRYHSVFIRRPQRIRRILDSNYSIASGETTMPERRDAFLARWERTRASTSCPEQILHMDSSGFVGDTFFVWYTDSIEFPGLPTFRRQLYVDRPLVDTEDDD